MAAKQKPQLCFIINQYRNPVVSILTLRFPGETPAKVKQCLDAALATLPFRTLYSYVIFDCSSSAAELMAELRVENVVDSPGAKKVVLALAAKCERKFFLPRDPKTRKFVDIDKQVQCLKVLRVGRKYR